MIKEDNFISRRDKVGRGCCCFIETDSLTSKESKFLYKIVTVLRRLMSTVFITSGFLSP